MIAKKSKKSNLENKRFGIFLLGLVSASAFALAAFEWNSIVGLDEEKRMAKVEEDINLDDIPEIHYIKPKPVPAQPKPKKVNNNDFKEVKELVKETKVLDTKIEKVVIDPTPIKPTNIGGDGPIIEKSKVFEVVEKMPEFPGGIKEMYKFLGKNIHYPSIPKSENIEGKVWVSFIINEEGKIDKIKILRDVNGLFGNEAKRVIRMMPDWTPGEQRGKKVKVRYTLPINFELD